MHEEAVVNPLRLPKSRERTDLRFLEPKWCGLLFKNAATRANILIIEFLVLQLFLRLRKASTSTPFDSKPLCTNWRDLELTFWNLGYNSCTPAYVESVNLPSDDSGSKFGIPIEPQRKDFFGTPVQRGIEGLLPASRYAKHAAPQTKALLANKKLSLVGSEIICLV